MPAILALETATEACSAALWANGMLSAQREIAPQRHAQLILPMCEHLLSEQKIQPAQLDAVAFGQGPGSFTGVRIATAVAQGIALAHNLPLIPVSCLQALAQAAYQQHDAPAVLAAIDARMQEVYWGEFHLQGEIMELQGEACIAPVTQLPFPSGKDYLGAGTGWQRYGADLQRLFAGKILRYDGALFPTAAAIIPLALAAWQRGETVPAIAAQPLYLRNDVVK